jgi:hypothetical protein
LSSPGTESPESDAEALVRRLVALEEGAIRCRAAARWLSRKEPERVARLLGELLGRGGDAGAMAALAALGQALGDPPLLRYEWIAATYAAARALELPAVAALLLSPRPHRPWREPRDRSDPAMAQLTLGHKKSLGRLRRDPDLLARLAAEGDPEVVREVLRNPLLVEADAVRIAARRPARPDTLRCLYVDRRWRTRAAVRRALARNPYAETGMALRILPTLALRDLDEMGADPTLHPVVRETAARLAGERTRRRRR